MAELNKELILKFAEEIEDGLPLLYTCDLLEITWYTLNNWMKQGEADAIADKKTIHAQLFTSLKKAYAKFIKATKKRIYNGETGWQGSAWWLERTNKNFVLNNEDNGSSETVIVNPIVVKKK